MADSGIKIHELHQTFEEFLYLSRPEKGTRKSSDENFSGFLCVSVSGRLVKRFSNFGDDLYNSALFSDGLKSTDNGLEGIVQNHFFKKLGKVFRIFV